VKRAYPSRVNLVSTDSKAPKENLVYTALKEIREKKPNVPKILNSSRVTKDKKVKRVTWASEVNQVIRVNQD